MRRGAPIVFFERFRAELARYADGVHELGPPADEAEVAGVESRLGRALPRQLADFYRAWNGLRLFTDSFVWFPLDELAASDDAIEVGAALGQPLAVDADGRVRERDDGGDSLVAGSSVEAWLAAVMARERLLVDREGEWREVFDGGEVGDEVRRKRMRAALKADPGAAAWHVEAAELAFEDGDAAAAATALARAVEIDPSAGAAWALLAAIEARAGQRDAAEKAFARAAEATLDGPRRALRWAEAARAAAQADAEARRAGHAARALAIAGAESLLAHWIADARAALADGDSEGAHNLATLAAALAPGGEVAELVRQSRIRRALKPI